MKREPKTISLTLVSLEVGELPGGGRDEVPREARDHQEDRAEHCEVEALVRPKDSSCAQ